MKQISFLFALLAGSLFACSPAPTTDAGDASTNGDTAIVDAASDMNVADTSIALFGACTANAECGASGICLTNYPGGLCSKHCSTDTACPGGHCVMNQCLPTCSVGGHECSPSQVCDNSDPATPDIFVCFPACSLDMGATACNARLNCNLYDGAGQCTAAPAPTTGGNDGDPCVDDTECKGVCVTELDSAGAPQGYPNGFCISFGRTPADSLYAPGQPLPRGNCPTGDVAVPVGTNASDGDIAYCEHECHTHADCRLGYGCLFFEGMSGTRTSTGYCDAINCLAADFAALPNNNCPVGFTCQSQPNDSGMPDGTCVRTVVTDGGVGDAGDSATGTDASDVTVTDASPG